MTTHQAQVPRVAREYFEWRLGLDVTSFENHPVIREVFTPGKGWRLHPTRKRVSGAWVRKLRREQGVTAIQLESHGVLADFNAKELTKR